MEPPVNHPVGLPDSSGLAPVTNMQTTDSRRQAALRPQEDGKRQETTEWYRQNGTPAHDSSSRVSAGPSGDLRHVARVGVAGSNPVVRSKHGGA